MDIIKDFLEQRIKDLCEDIDIYTEAGEEFTEEKNRVLERLREAEFILMHVLFYSPKVETKELDDNSNPVMVM